MFVMDCTEQEQKGKRKKHRAKSTQIRKESRHRKTMTGMSVSENESMDSKEDVKSFNDSILFNTRPLTPNPNTSKSSNSNSSGLFKLSHSFFSFLSCFSFLKMTGKKLACY